SAAPWVNCFDQRLPHTIFRQLGTLKCEGGKKSGPCDWRQHSHQVPVFFFFPGVRFLGEESVGAGERLELTDLPTWIIDPIDGTVNFVHRSEAPPP
uniref:Uncharacterized protein n=1 Tax=Hippocampus comes TaxID=109280 RepID=A0A3Q2Z0R9_HIPCM